MFQRQPAYYRDFQCIGSACHDNCCIGWEIDIDADSYERYLRQEGFIGQRLRQYISVEEYPHFILQEGERCPFLNAENLCDLIIELGEESLCNICMEHPRFYNCFGDYREAGLGLCCEEAVRCMLADSDPLRFELIETNEAATEYSDEELWNILYPLREVMFSILQNRGYDLKERLWVLLTLAEQAQYALDEQIPMDWESFRAYYADAAHWQVLLPSDQSDMVSSSDRRCFYKEVLHCYQGLEILDPDWLKMLKAMEQRGEQVLEEMSSFEKVCHERLYVYEHFMVYLIYRYVLQAVWDGDVFSKVAFAVLSCCFLQWMDVLSWLDGSFTEDRQMEHIKNYSKEIEYSTENIEKLEQFLYDKNVRDGL
ncbi:MAG: flagellin lysine-N-methylase [Lachnospiraceae bacterium]|jgi:lysine-N-methylase